MEDDLCRKMAFMDDDLWWRFPSKWWFRSIFFQVIFIFEVVSMFDVVFILGRRTLMEDDLWWKMTSVGRWPLWMTTLDGRFLQSNGFGPSFWGRLYFWGRLNLWCRIHFLKTTFAEDDPCWKTTFDASPYFCQCLSFQVTSKQWFWSILAGEANHLYFLSKRLSRINWRRF